MYVKIYNTAQTNGRWNLFCCLILSCLFVFSKSCSEIIHLYLICKIRKFYCGSSVTGHVFSRDTTHHSSCYLPRKGHRVSWMKCLTIVITLFVVCLWCSILFMDRRPEHCHRDFALIVIVKTTSSLLYLAVRKTWGSLTCFGFICSVLNSLCILNGARDKS